MEHSEKFDMVKSHYDDGSWNIERVRYAVGKGWITSEEFKEITSQEY